MTRNFITAASVAALTTALGTTAFAEAHEAGNEMSAQSGMVSEEAMNNMVRASQITDGVVYTMQTYEADDWMGRDRYDTVGTEWDQIGNIVDVAMTPEGDLTGIIVETGGFLDIGDSHVLVTLDDVRLVNDPNVNSYSYVTRLTEEELQDLPEVGENWW